MTDPQQALDSLIHLVARDPLLERLDTGRRRRLTLVQAPVGFGKTTLLTQWQTRLRYAGVAVAWVVLREDSWTPELFLRALPLRSNQRESKSSSGTVCSSGAAPSHGGATSTPCSSRFGAPRRRS
jgi:ATP/maltotriose-dependent transcriptional regulator MalT